MPAFNSSVFISESIISVINQTYTYWELIVVDDCSTDTTLDILNKFKAIDDRIIIISNNENSGNPGLARNIGIKYCTGNYIAFIDSDDVWDCRKLEVQLNFMKLNNTDLSFTYYKCINEQGDNIKYNILIPKYVTYKKLLKCNYIGLSTSMYNCKKIGKFYFEKVGHEDYQYWLNILKLGVTAYGIKQPLSYYRVHNNSISSNKIRSALFTWNILFKYQKLGILKALYFFISYTFFAIWKRVI